MPYRNEGMSEAGLKQVNGERVAQRMRPDWFADTALLVSNLLPPQFIASRSRRRFRPPPCGSPARRVGHPEDAHPHVVLTRAITSGWSACPRWEFA